MHHFTPQQRASIVANYLSSGLSQKAFCASHNVSARSLRSWMRRHAPRPEPVAQVIAEIDGVLSAVESVRARLARWQAVPFHDGLAPAAGNGAPLATMPLSTASEPIRASHPHAVPPLVAAPAASPVQTPLSPPPSAHASPPQALPGTARLACRLPGFPPPENAPRPARRGFYFGEDDDEQDVS